MKKLKLFVWEDSLRSYGYGIMFAYAPTVEIARELIMNSMGNKRMHDDLKREPKIITEPYANYVWGSD